MSALLTETIERQLKADEERIKLQKERLEPSEKQMQEMREHDATLMDLLTAAIVGKK